MPSSGPDPADVARRAKDIYERDIRPQVEPEHDEKFLALDIRTRDYEIDRDDLAAIDRVEANHPGGAGSRFLFRIGHPSAHRIGGSTLRVGL